MFAAIPFDQQVHDTYFVVAHFHFVIFGAAVFPMLGGLYYWFPKVTGRMYHERVGQAVVLARVRRHGADVLPDAHRRAARACRARQYTYPAEPRLGRAEPARDARLLPARRRPAAGRREPRRAACFRGARGRAATRSTARRSNGRPRSPPPPYNFAVIPAVTSPYPMWDERDREADRRALDARRARPRAGTRDAGHHRRRRRARRGARHALGLAVADRPRAALVGWCS